MDFKNQKLKTRITNYFLFLIKYLAKRLHLAGLHFEATKDIFVNTLLWKRGVMHRPFVHASLLFLAVVAIVAGGKVGGKSIVAGVYPGVSTEQVFANDPVENSIPIETIVTPITIISDKPRDKIFEYDVKSGDTVSAIANNFGISTTTIRWANDMSDVDDIFPGDKLKILPVSGVAHKVVSGDTIHSVAKKYQAESQAILDFPFNDVGDNLALKSGQILIVPDGAPPSKPKPPPTQYLARSAIPQTAISGKGIFGWPARGQQISQYFAWYHKGIDISNLSGGPISAADGGKVVVSGWPDTSGYGRRVIIDHGNGYQTLYAHLSSTAVSAGQFVSKGQQVGMMGATGRATGVHLHFEVHKSGVALNPLGVLGR